MARWLDRRQVSSFFTCYWLCGGCVLGVCTCFLFSVDFVQRCLGEVLAGEEDVKKGERCFLAAAWVVPGWGRRGGFGK